MRTYLDILKELSEIPNAPFSPLPRLAYLKSFIEARELEWEENNYALIVKAGSQNSKKKLVLMSHVDHPGFVLKNENEYLSFGTLYTEKISEQYKTEYPGLDIYKKSGELIETASIKDVDAKHVKISAQKEIPINSQGLWHVEKFKTTADKVYCRSHDNDLPTALMLSVLDKYAESPYQILFVFTIYEEVFQYSSYALARNNTLKIGADDIVINLESMKAYNIAPGLKEFGKVNYTDGPILHISEKGTLYGGHAKVDNKAEDLILSVCDKNKIKIQQGLAGGSNDARPFSEFKRTPHIVTINVPNKYKHNVTPTGEVVTEEVLKKDSDAVKEILSKLLQAAPSYEEIKKTPKSLSLKAKNSSFAGDKSLIRHKAILNERLYWAYSAKTRRRHYYAENIFEALEDFLYKAISYIVWSFNKATKR